MYVLWYNKIKYVKSNEKRVLNLAFCDLKAVTARDDKTGATYIFGNVFSVFSLGAELPLVYSWDLVRAVDISKNEVKILTKVKNFAVAFKMFRSEEDLLKTITIIECMQKKYSFSYKHERRMFPLKSAYRECLPGKETYVGEGILDENETAAAFIALLNFRMVKLLWLVALLIAFITLGLLHYLIGVNRGNILYFVPISIVSGGIIAVLMYIFTHLIARAKVKRMCKSDIATRQVITYVVSRAGFATCESCVYTGRDLIPWNEMEYFVESDKMFILYKNNAPAAYIPKKAFDKKQVGSVADIIALHLEQR